MQNTGALYTDFITTLRRIYMLYLKLLKTSNEKIGISSSIKTEALLILYFFDDEFTTYEHLHDKGLDIEQDSLYIRTLVQQEYLEDDGMKIILTKKGQEIKNALDKQFENEEKNLLYKGMLPKELSHIIAILLRFEHYWINSLI